MPRAPALLPKIAQADDCTLDTTLVPLLSDGQKSPPSALLVSFFPRLVHLSAADETRGSLLSALVISKYLKTVFLPLHFFFFLC